MWKSIKLFHSFIYSVAWNISTFHANKYHEQTIDQKYITKCLLSLSLSIFMRITSAQNMQIGILFNKNIV